MERCVADEPLANLDARPRRRIAIPDGHLDLEPAGGLVEEQDAEGAVIDDSPGKIREPHQELVEIEDRSELAADLREGLEHAGVFALALEEPGVLDRHCNVSAEDAQDHR